MKFFKYDETIDRQLTMVQIKVRQLMNGDIAEQIQTAGLNYKKLYGVSLVHLRKLALEFKPDNNLADRLWYMQTRETMILATMIAERDCLPTEKLKEWIELVSNIELAEQFAFNLLGKRINSTSFIEEIILHPNLNVRYMAFMSIGWQFRFVGHDMAQVIKSNLKVIEALAIDESLTHAVTHSLKTAGRFSAELKPTIASLATNWTQNENKHLKNAGEEILFELENSL